jgi:large subunit ribosomal protein L21
MQVAVIKTGGKQYLVRPGEKLKVEKLDAEEGADFTFSDVLLIADDDATTLGTPTVNGAKVEARVVRQARARKVIVFKYLHKTRRRTKNTHRQPFTEVEIGKIVSEI